MTIAEKFASLYASFRDETMAPELVPVELARACVAVLPIAGAGISMFSGTDIRVPVGASDDDAARAERLQFTADEGPCLDAHRTASPVLATAPVLAERWPDFHRRLLSATPYRSILAFPLSGALGGVGSVDLYCTGAEEAQGLDLADVAAVSAEVTNSLLDDDVFAETSPDPLWLDGPGAVGRNEVLIAMGMVSVAHDIPAPDALAKLRRYAMTHDETVDQIAAGVIRRRIPVSQLAEASR
ncbi:ANTAR domain-containing protein [Nakamurella sp. GG22]